MIAHMKSFLDRLATLYPDQVDHQHARSLVLIAWVLLGAIAILIALTVLGAITQASGLAWTNLLIVPLVIMTPTMLLILVLINQGMLQWARLLFVGVLLLLSAETFFSRGITTAQPGFVVLPIITAAMLFGVRGTLVTMIICALLSFSGWVLERLAGVVQPPPLYPNSGVIGTGLFAADHRHLQSAADPFLRQPANGPDAVPTGREPVAHYHQHRSGSDGKHPDGRVSAPPGGDDPRAAQLLSCAGVPNR